MHILLDATQPTTPTDFLSMGNVSVVGVSFALLAYIIRVTLPKIVADFREDTKMQREAHSEVMDKQQKLFSDELAKERDLSMRRETTWRETLLNIMRDGSRNATQTTNLPTANVQNMSAST